MPMSRRDGASCKPSMGSHARSPEADRARHGSSIGRRPRCKHKGMA